MTTVTSVIVANRQRAEDEPAGGRAAHRVEEGEQELIDLESEQGMLESEITDRESRPPGLS